MNYLRITSGLWMPEPCHNLPGMIPGAGLYGGAVTPGTINYTGAANASNNATSYNLSVPCGAVAGDMICALVSGDSSGTPTLDTWTLDGQTVTHLFALTEESGSRGNMAIGTATGVTTGTNTMNAVFSEQANRCLCACWEVTGCDMSVAIQTGTSNNSLTFSFGSAYTPGSVIVGAGTNANSNAFTGSSGLAFDASNDGEARQGLCSDAEADAASTTVTLTPGGSTSDLQSGGLEIGP